MRSDAHRNSNTEMITRKVSKVLGYRKIWVETEWWMSMSCLWHRMMVNYFTNVREWWSISFPMKRRLKAIYIKLLLLTDQLKGTFKMSTIDIMLLIHAGGVLFVWPCWLQSKTLFCQDKHLLDNDLYYIVFLYVYAVFNHNLKKADILMKYCYILKHNTNIAGAPDHMW